MSEGTVVALFGTLAAFAISGATVLIAAGLRFTHVATAVEALAKEVTHLAENMLRRDDDLDRKVDRIQYEVTHTNDGTTVKGTLVKHGTRLAHVERALNLLTPNYTEPPETGQELDD